MPKLLNPSVNEDTGITDPIGVKDCNVQDNFGYAREWLLYEILAYYI